MVGGGSVDSVSNNWGSVDSVGNNWGSVHSVGNWVSNNWGMDSVVSSVDNGGSVDSVVDWSVSKDWGVVSNSVGGDGVDGSNSSLAHSNWSVGSNAGLHLSQTLGIVSLVD